MARASRSISKAAIRANKSKVASYIGAGILGGGGVTPSLPLPVANSNWRLPITAAIDSGNETALVSALVGSETTKARPNYVVAANASRTIAMRTGAVAAPGGILSYHCSSSNFTVAAEESYDSTDGVNGTWSAITANRVAPSSAYVITRQIIRLAAGPARWVRYTIRAGEALTVKPLAHQLRADGRHDAMLVVGASIEVMSMHSDELEVALLAAYPARDPIVFNTAYGAQRVAGVASVLPAAATEWGDIYSSVLVGNIIGNDITAQAAIADDTPAELDAVRSVADGVMTAFPGKNIFACRTSYRQYTGTLNRTSPLYPTKGALPYDLVITDPLVQLRNADAFDAALLIPRVDMYALHQRWRTELSDEVHPGDALKARIRDEWVRTAGRRFYVGTWPVSYTEKLVADYEASKTFSDRACARFAVAALPDSAAKTALLARIAGVALQVASHVVKVRYGTTGLLAGWTSIPQSTANDGRTLLDENGLETGYGHEFPTPGAANSASGGAQGAAAGALFPDAVLLAYINTTTTPLVQKFTNLLPGRIYNLRAMASRSGTGSVLTEFTCGGQSVQINPFGNVSTVAEFNVAADANGEVSMTVGRVGTTGNGYLNAAILSLAA